MKYEVTVNRDDIDRKVGLPVRVTSTVNPDCFVDFEAIRVVGDSIIRRGPARRNGATVWIECDAFEEIRP